MGKLSRQAAMEWGQRRSGVPGLGHSRDIRQDGFAAYSMVDFKPVVREEGVATPA
jgi:NADH:ubiquinone oxidoreductase subunit D